MSYTLIASDCHAGADGVEYREYLETAYFERWRR